MAAAVAGVGQATGTAKLEGLGQAIKAVQSGDVAGVARVAAGGGFLPADVSRAIQSATDQVSPVLDAVNRRDVPALIQTLGNHVDPAFSRRIEQEGQAAAKEVLISDRRTGLPESAGIA